MPEYIINQLTVLALDEDGNVIRNSNNQPIAYDVCDLDCSSICDDLNYAINEGDAYTTPINPSN